MKTAGVPLVVADGIGGVLSPFDDAEAYAASIRRVLQDSDLRRSLSDDGKAYVMNNHDVSSVAATFRQALVPVVSTG